MNYLQQVQAGIDYIEAHLDFDIELHDVGAVAAISQWHFQRIFKALTNETLKTYIRSRRMANALDKLLKTKERIIDIAFAAGFESQEAFSRAFKKAFAMTPNQYRKLGDNNLFLQKVQIDTAYLEHINQNLTLEPEIVTLPALTLIGFKTNFYSVDSEKNNLAEKLPPLWGRFLQRLHEMEIEMEDLSYGVIRQELGMGERLEYYAAIALRSELVEGAKTEGMSQVEIPSATYAKFAHRGDPLLLNDTVNYIYGSWLMQSQWRHTYQPDLEIYGSEYVLGSTQSVIHYAIPISDGSHRQQQYNRFK